MENLLSSLGDFVVTQDRSRFLAERLGELGHALAAHGLMIEYLRMGDTAGALRAHQEVSAFLHHEGQRLSSEIDFQARRTSDN